MMSFNYFLINLKMSLMHVFTQKLIDELDALNENRVLEESFQEFAQRHLNAFLGMCGATPEHDEAIKTAVLEAIDECKLEVAIVGQVTQEGAGREINQIVRITQFWEDSVTKIKH